MRRLFQDPRLETLRSVQMPYGFFNPNIGSPVAAGFRKALNQPATKKYAVYAFERIAVPLPLVQLPQGAPLFDLVQSPPKRRKDITQHVDLVGRCRIFFSHDRRSF